MFQDKNAYTAFSSVFERYKKPYVLFAYSYIRDMDEAEDIYMDVMLHFWENRDRLPEDLHIPSYLLAAVKNRALNYLRHRQVISDTHSGLLEHEQRELNFRISTLEACEPSQLFADEIKHIIDDTLNHMPERTKVIFFMSRYENKTNKEIAQKLSLNIKTVEYHIGKALKALRTNLKDYLPLFFIGLMYHGLK
ncbi:MAG: RNA polymerase sigma-70 factor [Tannerella sp.]|jgi:RNA polymerase sigma-70 factor (ECF subfamily)|nr:RNA polymerase sigma-70 factor [Tannerella sp.]